MEKQVWARELYAHFHHDFHRQGETSAPNGLGEQSPAWDEKNPGSDEIDRIVLWCVSLSLDRGTKDLNLRTRRVRVWKEACRWKAEPGL